MRLRSFYLTLILFCLSTMLPAAPLQSPGDQKLARTIFQEFIELPTVYETGDTRPLINAANHHLRKAGFNDVDIFIGGATPNKSNLVVRYRGTGEQKPILLLAHVDVVAAKSSDWSMDPFSFIERDGYFYGRGTSDDKAEAALWIANLIQLKREGFKPKRDIIVALTADEEGTSSANGVMWLLKNHPDLINAEFALNEGGLAEMVNGKPFVNEVQLSEKYVANFTLEVRNKGGHSSLPVADNAIYHLANALVRLSQYQFPLKLNTVTTAYFSTIAKTESKENKGLIQAAIQGSQPALQKLAAHSPFWNATLHTTCTPTLLEGGHAMNALPQLAMATVNCRIMPDENPEMIQHTLQTVIHDPNVKMTLTNQPERSLPSPMRADVMDTASELTHTFWPSATMAPMMVMGATDGAYLRNAGIPTYGVSGLFIERDELRAHGRDERLPVQSFYDGQAFLYALVKKLSE